MNDVLKQMLNDIDVGLKNALIRVNELVAENKALKEALAQDDLCSSQEPWMYRIWNDKDAQWRLTDDCSWPAEPIYTTPPNPKSQPEQEPSITKTGCGVLTLHSGFDDLPDGTKFYTTPPKPEPRNFCPRCGKRTADLTVIHTCTPPEGGHQ